VKEWSEDTVGGEEWERLVVLEREFNRCWGGGGGGGGVWEILNFFKF